jgi:SAM-dependent methyltransferase
MAWSAVAAARTAGATWSSSPGWEVADCRPSGGSRPARRPAPPPRRQRVPVRSAKAASPDPSLSCGRFWQLSSARLVQRRRGPADHPPAGRSVRPGAPRSAAGEAVKVRAVSWRGCNAAANGGGADRRWRVSVDQMTVEQPPLAAMGANVAAVESGILMASELLCKSVDLRAGERVLDVACGSGNAALAAARRFCRVVAVDDRPDLLDRARLRGEAERLEVSFLDGEAADLPAPAGSFDVVLSGGSGFSVLAETDAERAAAELMRVCRPGGWIGMIAWTPDGYVGAIAAPQPPLALPVGGAPCAGARRRPRPDRRGAPGAGARPFRRAAGRHGRPGEALRRLGRRHPRPPARLPRGRRPQALVAVASLCGRRRGGGAPRIGVWSSTARICH